MAEDPFEAFKKKKAQQKELEKQAQNPQTSDWVEGIGPGKPEPQVPGKPKGFGRGRYNVKPPNPAEIAKLKPKGLDPTRLTKAGPNASDPKAKPVDPKSLPPEKARRPTKFNRY